METWSLIIINHQIDEKISNFHQKWGWKVNFVEYIWTNILINMVQDTFYLVNQLDTTKIFFPPHLQSKYDHFSSKYWFKDDIFDHNWPSNWWKDIKFCHKMRFQHVGVKLLTKCLGPIFKSVLKTRQCLDIGVPTQCISTCTNWSMPFTPSRKSLPNAIKFYFV